MIQTRKIEIGSPETKEDKAIHTILENLFDTLTTSSHSLALDDDVSSMEYYSMCYTVILAFTGVGIDMFCEKVGGKYDLKLFTRLARQMLNEYVDDTEAQIDEGVFDHDTKRKHKCSH